eukprot:scaffold313518_cov22-Tisochrysis_lutea.AAC.1
MVCCRGQAAPGHGAYRHLKPGCSQSVLTIDSLEGCDHIVLLTGQPFATPGINSGKIAEAEQLLDQVLEGSPKELGALVARGTARALRRDLTGAHARAR